MEEFVGHETRNIYEALTSGIHSVEWPGHCRNCDWVYSDQMKRDVVKKTLDNTVSDFLRIVSDVFKSTIPDDMKVRYCCINNFRPRIQRNFPMEEDEDSGRGKRYRVFSETLVIEEGLDEWYGVSWAIDDTDILEESGREVAPLPTPPAGGMATSCHTHGHHPASLFNLLEKLTI